MGKTVPKRRREAIAETEDWNCYRHYLVVITKIGYRLGKSSTYRQLA